MTFKKKKIGIFMSNGTGLSVWEKVGSIKREMALYEDLCNKGWKVSMFTYDRASYPSVGHGIAVYPQGALSFLRGRIGFVYGMFLPFRWFKYGIKQSIVMTNQAHAGWPAMIAKFLWRTPLVARSGYVFGEQGIQGFGAAIRRWTEKLIYKVADVAIVPTEELKSWVVENYGISATKITVIPNYVDSNVFNPSVGRHRQKNSVVMVGRLDKVKRIDLVISAMKGLGYPLVLVGEGEEDTNLRKLAIQEGVKVEFRGMVPNEDLPGVLSEALIYVCSSLREGHPKALIEAMGCGIPVIGTVSRGIKNVIANRETGLLVDGSVMALNEGLRLLITDHDLREMIGKNASKYVDENYSLGRVSMKYQEVFSRYVSGA